MHGDELTFSLAVEHIGGSSMRFLIKAEKDGKVRFQARQTVVWADLEGAPRPVRIDGEWRRRFELYLQP
jgi:4-hydroxybenzoyl-CoA thioesterase